MEYYDYKQLTKFDDAVIEVLVLKHYEKYKDGKSYQVLKLATEEGAKFYITTTAPLKNLVGHKTMVWIKSRYITFYEYLKGFATKGGVISISREKGDTYRLGDALDKLHSNSKVAEVYGALFFALPLSRELQERFSMLGVSHLLAISGFHLGVLSLILFALFRWPYRQLQQHYFPHRHGNRDLFLVVALLLGLYLLFLGEVASLLRAYVMLVVGYVLHDRGMKIVSMQTLVITMVLLLSLWPTLLFSLGFWLSISGVYFIFLYLHYFKDLPKMVSFLAIAVWVYLLMTPVSLVLFGNYSLHHPLSIVWSLLFTLFYPLALLLHLIGFGDLLDTFLLYGLNIDLEGVRFQFHTAWLIPYTLLAIGAYRFKSLLVVIVVVATGVSIATIHQIT